MYSERQNDFLRKLGREELEGKNLVKKRGRRKRRKEYRKEENNEDIYYYYDGDDMVY